MKICTKCGESKTLDMYSITATFVKRGDCKSCQAEYHKAYYLVNKEQMMLNQKFRNARKSNSRK